MNRLLLLRLRARLRDAFKPLSEAAVGGLTIAMLRTTRGDDIAAACGQLVGEVADRTKRQARYLARVKASEVA